MDNYFPMDFYVCDICERKYSSTKPLIRHYKQVHGINERFKCNYCDKLFKFRDKLITHESAVHSSNKKKECKICNVKVVHYDIHLKNVHTTSNSMKKEKIKSKIECNICKKKISSIKGVKKHIERVHIGLEKKFSYSNEEGLAPHQIDLSGNYLKIL